ncbi:Hypothetical protein PP7435_CHR1-0618 [Komagataella phaffii CBS 7435]|uniref:Uncharacterized protein n=2 Tax=Komagataella phaffii TaxID=460519 RepID=C4QWQ2_KOMPG|nr:uncharacterized protein PAS_chr1-1_0495 [Komagataella phaffii GS115]AOA61148.1 GQ67_02883T0 [Komagataella phaffii]CAH2446431.1 Hypothetical protein BQ9382_C1-3175 [Komagataella phaffii CBS 7435]AOA66629.1 GQ68_02364T0 [Komagataella phaffii GS115]CAY67675.1 hypothetical protein PAS_chr1-1_0495 [Komagataella phaffii GS115]SCV11825.1 Hypothetical protein PP7435_CHR1-0618 [Komagataella phaffii CBS 7435]
MSSDKSSQSRIGNYLITYLMTLLNEAYDFETLAQHATVRGKFQEAIEYHKQAYDTFGKLLLELDNPEATRAVEVLRTSVKNRLGQLKILQENETAKKVKESTKNEPKVNFSFDQAKIIKSIVGNINTILIRNLNVDLNDKDVNKQSLLRLEDRSPYTQAGERDSAKESERLLLLYKNKCQQNADFVMELYEFLNNILKTQNPSSLLSSQDQLEPKNTELNRYKSIIGQLQEKISALGRDKVILESQLIRRRRQRFEPD